MFVNYSANVQRTPFVIKSGDGRPVSHWPNATRAVSRAKTMAKRSGAHLYVVDDRSGVILADINRPISS